MTQTAEPITNVRYHRNRTKRGNVSYAKTTQSIAYYGYGKPVTNPYRQLRGTWHDEQGAVATHDDTLEWARQKSRQHQYTYKLVLSLRDGPMQARDFVQAMRASDSERWQGWRLIVHRDTEHVHAHVVAFRDKKLPKEAFQQWKQETAAVLASLEGQRLAAQTETQHQVSRADEASQSDAPGWATAAPPHGAERVVLDEEQAWGWEME
jgi:hypothetical protein